MFLGDKNKQRETGSLQNGATDSTDEAGEAMSGPAARSLSASMFEKSCASRVNKLCEL